MFLTQQSAFTAILLFLMFSPLLGLIPVFFWSLFSHVLRLLYREQKFHAKNYHVLLGWGQIEFTRWVLLISHWVDRRPGQECSPGGILAACRSAKQVGTSPCLFHWHPCVPLHTVANEQHRLELVQPKMFWHLELNKAGHTDSLPNFSARRIWPHVHKDCLSTFAQCPQWLKAQKVQTGSAGIMFISGFSHTDLKLTGRLSTSSSYQSSWCTPADPSDEANSPLQLTEQKPIGLIHQERSPVFPAQNLPSHL